MTTTTARRVLCFAPLAHTYEELCLSVRGQDWLDAEVAGSTCTWSGRGLRLEVERVGSVEKVFEALASDYYNLIVIDCRDVPHPDANPAAQKRALDRLFAARGRERDRERRYPKGRILVLVGDDDEQRVDNLIFELGQHHVGGCIRDLSLSPLLRGAARREARRRFLEQVWAHFRRLFARRRTTTRSINCAGGGISGIYYELGVLKCLHDALDVDVRDFELFFGISGGAVVASCLANGFHIDDLIAKLGDMDRSWRYKLRVGWKQLNVGELPRRLVLAQRELTDYVVRMVRRQDDFSVASLLGAYAVALGPLFDNADFERVLRELFTRPGRANDFRELDRRLYVGASDQDSREPVLFGASGYDHIPISIAIQASTAMHPFFPSVEIDGRHYTDGIVTRTSNLKASLDRGADLVFVVDPFVPLISDEPGFNARHGNMWVMEQDYKTMAYTRFAQARNEIVRQNPHAAIYTFVPSRRMRRLMSGQSPFVSRNFHPIVCAAYRSTYRRLKRLEHKVTGDLAGRGMRLDLGPVEECVNRLRSTRKADVRMLLDERPADNSDTRVA